MESLKQILAQMAETNPTLQTAMQQSQASQILPADMLAPLAKYRAKYQPQEYYIAVYWPDRYFSHGKALMREMTDRLGGATCANGCSGMWKSPKNEIVSDDILLIKSFAEAREISKHLESIINRVCYWGKVCNEAVMAVEIGCVMGSILLLIPIA